jgi:hypothetical protein
MESCGKENSGKNKKIRKSKPPQTSYDSTGQAFRCTLGISGNYYLGFDKFGQCPPLD